MRKTEQSPLSFGAWVHESGIEREYENFHGDYGDAACLLSDYKEYHYQCYLHRHNITPIGYWVDLT